MVARQRHTLSHPRAPRPLAASLVALAETPDDGPTIDLQLKLIARLAADRVAAAGYASITTLRGEEYTTVAASSDLAIAVDEAQYAAQAGPCLEALDTGEPVAVPDISGTMLWPGFCAAAFRMGLRASVSVPLFTGSGAPVAVLNLYGHDDDAMAPLIFAVWSVYDPSRSMPEGSYALPPLDDGGQELVDGFAEALTVRATIQLAINIMMKRRTCSAYDAYVALRTAAADTGVSLTGAATAVITQDA
jgi:hypothetical protein